MILIQVLPELGHAVHLPEGVLVNEVSKKVVYHAFGVPSKVLLCFIR